MVYQLSKINEVECQDIVNRETFTDPCLRNDNYEDAGLAQGTIANSDYSTRYIRGLRLLLVNNSIKGNENV